MIGSIKEKESNLFNHQRKLIDILNMDHPLCQLSFIIGWEEIEKEFAPLYCENNGSPSQPIRRMIGLFYLKHTYNLSDEQVVERWLENPYYQFFCGEEFFQHELPMDRSMLSKFRKRLDRAKLSSLLKETIKAGLTTKSVAPKSFERVNTDTTVMEKAIAYPTDARLYYKSILKLVKLAKEKAIVLRQTYTRKAKQAFIKHHRYASAKQFKRAQKPLKNLKSFAGRLHRDIKRKLEQTQQLLDVNSSALFFNIQRLLLQKKDSKQKLYALHAPEVECIAKGKVHKPYEFGCKVSFTVTSKDNFIIGCQTLHDNPYDGHTLKTALAHSQEILKSINPSFSIKTNYSDQGYKNHAIKEDDIEVLLSTKANHKRLKQKPWLHRWLKRRSAIEPIIGHTKHDGRMNRNYLKGKDGDQINAILSACGQNLRKILKKIEEDLLWLLFGWVKTIVIASLMLKGKRSIQAEVIW